MSDARSQLDVSLDPDPVIEAYKAGVDRTLLRERLRRSVEERLRDLMQMQEVAEELRRAGRDGDCALPPQTIRTFGIELL